MRRFALGLLVLSLSAIGVAAASLAPDVGPKADVAAVKAAEAASGKKIIAAHVSGNYALLNWYDEHASGPVIYRRVTGGHWKLLRRDGGATSVGILVQEGVPVAVARKLCAGWPRAYTLCGA